MLIYRFRASLWNPLSQTFVRMSGGDDSMVYQLPTYYFYLVVFLDVCYHKSGKYRS
ncbi:hypothetical protein HHA03_11940 [Halolactibacillus halophilus]|uniref:Uncharacterized protein n=1 Tax=Halolactibacillus halophilus TaxID=306540 RepID=A0ABQ0VKF3_9BACI|nr:hypothetical protein HHA03_11940 [Halolactibacillus halophilus]